jgi:hypothetical protein
MRRVKLFAWLVAAATACGGRVAAIEGEPTASDDGGMDTSTIADAVAVPDAGVIDAPEEPSTVDAGHDALPDVGCPPAAGQSIGCPGGAYCVIWLAADASPPSPGGVPDADILEWACEKGSLNTLCSGSPPVEVRYDVYANRVAWAVCEGQ